MRNPITKIVTVCEQVLVDIINHEMAMPANSVWVREQNRDIPNDNGLYISCGFINGIPLSNITRTYTVPDPQDSNNTIQQEVNTYQQTENIQIDVMSRSNAPLVRKAEVIMAMQSIYAQQQMELYNFKIARIPRAFLDTSGTEGGSTLKKYSITIACITCYTKTKTLGDYYDDFTTRVDDEKTIGTDKPLIEFEINKTGIVP